MSAHAQRRPPPSPARWWASAATGGRSRGAATRPRLFAGPASEFANFVKRFRRWILPELPGHLRRKRSRTSGRSSKASETRHEGRHPRHHRAVQQALTKPALSAAPSQHAEGSTNASRPAPDCRCRPGITFFAQSAFQATTISNHLPLHVPCARPVARVEGADEAPASRAAPPGRRRCTRSRSPARRSAETPGRSARRTRRSSEFANTSRGVPPQCEQSKLYMAA